MIVITWQFLFKQVCRIEKVSGTDLEILESSEHIKMSPSFISSNNAPSFLLLKGFLDDMVSFDCLQILLAHGANPNAQDEDGNTALHIVAAHPQADIRMDVVWNLFLKTDDTIRNNDGKTAYDLAKENPNFTDEEVLKIMKESVDA